MLEDYAGDMVAELRPLLPQNWERLVFYNEIGETTYTFCTCVRCSHSSEYIDLSTYCKQTKEAHMALDEAYEEIWRMALKGQEESRGVYSGWGEPWKAYTMVVERKTGHFSIDYEYNPPVIGAPEGWEEKYLI